MRYFGGKYRISGHIAEYINNLKPDVYIEPFCGSCNVGKKVKAPVRILSDSNKWLILLHTAIQNGWTPPNEISEELYKELRTHKPEDPLTAFAGFGCSFAGKWFGGYARGCSGRNYALNAKNSLLKSVKEIQGCKFVYQDYTEALKVNFDVAYLDPPYVNTTKYYGVSFDYSKFWNIVRIESLRGVVLISEYVAPSDFITVLSIKARTDIRNGANEREDRIEKLFKWCGPSAPSLPANSE